MRILIIDDSDAMRRIQRAVLARLGHREFGEAADAKAGLAICDRFEPDMILCDWSLPEMDGAAFVREFRRTNFTTPVIMVTSESESHAAIPCIRAGADEWLVKPFVPDDLAACMFDAIEARKAA